MVYRNSGIIVDIIMGVAWVRIGGRIWDGKLIAS